MGGNRYLQPTATTNDLFLYRTVDVAALQAIATYKEESNLHLFSFENGVFINFDTTHS